MFKGFLIKIRIRLQPNRIFMTIEFERIHLIQLPITVEPVGTKSRLIQLLHLCIETVILEAFIRRIRRLILHIEMDELGAQRDELRDLLQKIEGQLVSIAKPIRHMLVQRDRLLSTPASMLILQPDLVVLLCILTGGLSTDLNGRIRRTFSEAEFTGHRSVFITDLQQSLYLVAVHTHCLIIICRVAVDVCPAVIRVVGLIATTHGQVHRHHRILHSVALSSRCGTVAAASTTAAPVAAAVSVTCAPTSVEEAVPVSVPASVEEADPAPVEEAVLSSVFSVSASASSFVVVFSSLVCCAESVPL